MLKTVPTLELNCTCSRVINLSRWTTLLDSRTACEPSQPPSTTSRLVNTHSSQMLTSRWNSTNHANTTPKPNTLLCPNTSAMAPWGLLSRVTLSRWDVELMHASATSHLQKQKHRRIQIRYIIWNRLRSCMHVSMWSTWIQEEEFMVANLQRGPGAKMNWAFWMNCVCVSISKTE